MYIEEIKITNLRVFAEASATFQYPERAMKAGERVLTHPNVNLILGNNGAGKSSLLKAVALAVLGPLAERYPTMMIVRRRRGAKKLPPFKTPAGLLPGETCQVTADFMLTWQDLQAKPADHRRYPLPFHLTIEPRGSEEIPNLRENNWDPSAAGSGGSIWRPIFDNASPAFFAVGYGATRRVDTDPTAATPLQKMKHMPLRHQRIQSLFTEGYTLIQLGHWLPTLKTKNPGRYKQVCNLINEVLPEKIEFTQRTDRNGEYLFCQHGALVPFAALSDGCRAFIGWVADMLYHLCFGCPKGVKLVDNCGIVLVDEIDLHLHPEWQREILPKLAKTFPNLQFIVTSHSPIVVGTLQRENLWVCEPARDGDGSVLVQKDTGVNGLNADQILNTEYFGLESSRAPEKSRRLKRIANAVERKTPGQASAFLKSLVTAMEDEDEPVMEQVIAPVKKAAARRKKK